MTLDAALLFKEEIVQFLDVVGRITGIAIKVIVDRFQQFVKGNVSITVCIYFFVFDIATDLDNRPAARQFRRSIEQYMVSDKFKPAVEIDTKTILGLLK